ncbi:hypothetical protein ACOMHN_034141 [Nucella lapillus]
MDVETWCVNTLANSPERVVSDFGIMMAGATAMNGQIFLADGADFMGSIKDSPCTVVILDPLQPKGAASLLALMEREELSDGKLRVPELPALRRIIPCYWDGQGEVIGFLDMLEQQEESYVAEVTPDDLACIWNTSGSTGFSKLVPHPHSDLLRLASRSSTTLGLTLVPDDNAERAELVINGLKSTPSPDDGSVMENIRKSDANSSRQSIFRSSKENTEAKREGAVQQCFDVASPLTADSFSRKSLEEPPLEIQHAGSGRSTCTRQSAEERDRESDSRHPDHIWFFRARPFTYQVVLDPDQFEDCSNGKPLPGVEMKVVDDGEKPVCSGKMGEIIFRTDIQYPGYFNNEEATKKIILRDGWYRTGDVGYFNDRGDLCVVCRTAFTIMHGAFLIHPGWLEARIGTLPGVETVLVVPVPDPVLHQELCACVVPRPEAYLTAEKLREFCQTLFLTDSRDHMTHVPPYFLFFSALPTTATGKTRRVLPVAVVGIVYSVRPWPH